MSENQLDLSTDAIPLHSTTTTTTTGTTTTSPQIPLIVKEKSNVEVFDQGKWFQARVVEVDETNQRAKVHFYKWHARFDRWMDLISPYLRLSRKKKSKSKKAQSVQNTNYPPLLTSSTTPSSATPTTTIPPPPSTSTTANDLNLSESISLPGTPPMTPSSHNKVGRPPTPILSVDSYALAKWRNGLDYLCKVEAILPNPKANSAVQYRVRFVIDDVTSIVLPSNMKPISQEKAEHLLRTLNEPIPEEEEEVIYDQTLLRFRDRCRARRRRQRAAEDGSETSSPTITNSPRASSDLTTLSSPLGKRFKSSSTPTKITASTTSSSKKGPRGRPSKLSKDTSASAGGGGGGGGTSSTVGGKSPRKSSFRTPMRIQSKRLLQRVPPSSAAIVSSESQQQQQHSLTSSGSTWSVVKDSDNSCLSPNPNAINSSMPDDSSSSMLTTTTAAATTSSTTLSSSTRPPLKLSIRLNPSTPTPDLAHSHPPGVFTPQTPMTPCSLEEPQKHACPLCSDKNFRTSRQLEAHLRHYHQREPNATDTHSQPSIDSPTEMMMMMGGSGGGGGTGNNNTMTCGGGMLNNSTNSSKTPGRRRGQARQSLAISETASDLSAPAPDGDDDVLMLSTGGPGGESMSNLSASIGGANATNTPAHSLIYCPHCRGREDDCTTLIQCDSCLCWSHLACYRLLRAPPFWECDGCIKSVGSARMKKSRIGIWFNDWMSTGYLPGLLSSSTNHSSTSTTTKDEFNNSHSHPHSLPHPHSQPHHRDSNNANVNQNVLVAYLRQLLLNLNAMVAMQQRKQELAVRYKEVKRRLPKSKQVNSNNNFMEPAPPLSNSESPDKLLSSGLNDFWDLNFPVDIISLLSNDPVGTPQKGSLSQPSLDLNVPGPLPCLDPFIDFESTIDAVHSPHVITPGMLDVLGSPCSLQHTAPVVVNFNSPTMSSSFDHFANIPITVTASSTHHHHHLQQQQHHQQQHHHHIVGLDNVMEDNSMISTLSTGAGQNNEDGVVVGVAVGGGGGVVGQVDELSNLLPESEDLLGGFNVGDYDINSAEENESITMANVGEEVVVGGGGVGVVLPVVYNGIQSVNSLANDNSVQDDYERRVVEEMCQILQELREMDAVMKEMQEFCGPFLTKLEEESIIRGLRAARKGISRHCLLNNNNNNNNACGT